MLSKLLLPTAAQGAKFAKQFAAAGKWDQRMGLGKRSALGAGMAGAGMVGSYFVGKRGEQQKAYYGQAEFDRRFKGRHDLAGAALTTAGFAAGGITALGYRGIGGRIGLAAVGLGAVGLATVASPGSAIGLMVGGSAIMARKMLWNNRGAVGVAAGAAAVGGAFGYSKPIYPAAEGNITSAQHGGTVSRMNFSTAGLTMALHNNRHGS